MGSCLGRRESTPARTEGRGPPHPSSSTTGERTVKEALYRCLCTKHLQCNSSVVYTTTRTSTEMLVLYLEDKSSSFYLLKLASFTGRLLV